MQLIKVLLTLGVLSGCAPKTPQRPVPVIDNPNSETVEIEHVFRFHDKEMNVVCYHNNGYPNTLSCVKLGPSVRVSK